jgi:hypothetical protein
MGTKKSKIQLNSDVINTIIHCLNNTTLSPTLKGVRSNILLRYTITTMISNGYLKQAKGSGGKKTQGDFVCILNSGEIITCI